MTSLLVVGSYNQDLVWRTTQFPKPGETGTGHFSQGPGGKGFNQAMAAHRLGGQTRFIAARGDDALGQNAAALAQAEGLPCAWQVCPDTATGNAAIWLNDEGQNQILVDLAANHHLSVAHIQAHAESIHGARVLLIQQEAGPDASLEALCIAKAAGVLCIVNPAPANAKAGELHVMADVLTPNESEFAALLHTRGEMLNVDFIEQCDAETLHALARKLPYPNVVITLGARGAILSTPDGFQAFPAPKVRVVDTTGAGDCFNGALAAELANGALLPQACAFAVKASACKVERTGAALAMPNRLEIAARFG